MCVYVHARIVSTLISLLVIVLEILDDANCFSRVKGMNLTVFLPSIGKNTRRLYIDKEICLREEKHLIEPSSTLKN